MNAVFIGNGRINWKEKITQEFLAGLNIEVCFFDNGNVEKSTLKKSEIVFVHSETVFEGLFENYGKYLINKQVIVIVDRYNGKKIAGMIKRGICNIINVKDFDREIYSASVDAMNRAVEKRAASYNLSYIVRDEKLFVLDNDLDAVTHVVNQLILFSGKIFNNITHMEVALYEAIYNAIEHGNLEVSFDEKARLLENRLYEDFIAKRVGEMPYSQRKVRIKSIMDTEKQLITIKDDGKGFDWKSQYNRINGEELFLGVNGRGMKIMVSAFDKVMYNDEGNEVTLMKKRDK